MTLPDNADIVDLLLHQHQEVKRSLAEVEQLDGDSRAAAFARLQKLLSSHESAEQQVLHPITRDVAGNPRLAQQLLAEEDNIERSMAELNSIGSGNPDFNAKFSALRDAAFAHNEHEEEAEFPLLRSTQSAERLEEMAENLRVAQSMR